MKIEKISIYQLMAIIIVNRFLFGFSFMPTVSISPANQDAWIAEVLSGIMIYIFIVPLIIMATRFREKTFSEYTIIIMGRPIGLIIGLWYCIYLEMITLLTVVFLSDFMASAVYPETPFYIITLFILVPAAYAARKGLECIGRASIFFAIFVVSIILLYFVLNLNNMDFNYFLPILADSEPSNLLFGIFNNSSRFCDAFLVFTFLPFANDDEKWSVNKLLIVLITIFTTMNVVLTLSTQAVLSPLLAKTFRYPYFVSIQHINLFDIVQRIEFFNVISWIIIFLVKASSTFLAIAVILQRLFKTKSYKPFIIPLNIMILMPIIFTKISHFREFRILINDIAYLIIFVSNSVIPLIIFIVYLIRRKQLNKNYN